MAIDYQTPYTDITERTDTTLESLGMIFAGVTEDGAGDALRVEYSDLKAAILAAVPSSSPDFILIRDVKTSGTDGGTFTSGADQTRDLTEITSDTGGHASLSTNQIALAAGTYTFKINAIARAVGSHQAWLYNVTAASVVRAGTSEYNYQSTSVISDKITITATTIFEIRHRCTTTQADDGFGKACNFTSPGEEVYTIAEFWKIA